MTHVQTVSGCATRAGAFDQGNVGLPVALVCSEASSPVTWFHSNAREVEVVTCSASCIRHIAAPREPDNPYIHRLVMAIAPRLHAGRLVVVEPTTYPGAAYQEVLPIVALGGLTTPCGFLPAPSWEREPVVDYYEPCSPEALHAGKHQLTLKAVSSTVESYADYDAQWQAALFALATKVVDSRNSVAPLFVGIPTAGPGLVKA